MAEVGEGDDSGQETQDGLESVISLPRRQSRSPDFRTAQQSCSNNNPAGFPADSQPLSTHPTRQKGGIAM